MEFVTQQMTEQITSPSRSALLSKLKAQKSRLDEVLVDAPPETTPDKPKQSTRHKHSWNEAERLGFVEIAKQYTAPTSKDWPVFAEKLNAHLGYNNETQKLTPMQCQSYWYNSQPKTSKSEEPELVQKTRKSGGVKKSKKTTPKKATFTEAAMTILREAGVPMTADEIADRVMKRDMVATRGKTPQLTIAARIYSDIKTRGPNSDFTYVQPYVFGLKEFGEIKPEDLPVRKYKISKKKSSGKRKKKEAVVEASTSVDNNTNK
jgi:hypothetical protein